MEARVEEMRGAAEEARQESEGEYNGRCAQLQKELEQYTAQAARQQQDFDCLHKVTQFLLRTPLHPLQPPPSLPLYSDYISDDTAKGYCFVLMGFGFTAL